MFATSDLGGWRRRDARKADLDPDVCINEHSQRNPGAMVGAAMVNGIVFPPCFIEEGVRINTECYIRVLDDVHLPHCMARLGQTPRAGGGRKTTPNHTQEREIQLLTWPACSLGDRQFTSQLELRAMIVRTLSDLDPEAPEKACTTGLFHRCVACVRARGGHFEHRL